MSRLPDLRKQDLDDERLQVWEAVCHVRGAETVNEGSGLIGPFNSFVHAPDAGRHLIELGSALHGRTTLPTHAIELAILTVGARWRAEFEWWAHVPRARASGIPEGVIDAIGSGTTPDFGNDDSGDRLIYDVTCQLVQTGRID